MTMDNGAEPFSEGFARSPVDGKIGFINLNLALVIPARYDGALPFQDAGAEIKIDCRLNLTRRTLLPMKAAAGLASITMATGRSLGAVPVERSGHVCRKDRLKKIMRMALSFFFFFFFFFFFLYSRVLTIDREAAAYGSPAFAGDDDG